VTNSFDHFQFAVSKHEAENADKARGMFEPYFHDRFLRLRAETARTMYFDVVPMLENELISDPDLHSVARQLLNLEPQDLVSWKRFYDESATGRRFAVMLEHCHCLEAWSIPLLTESVKENTLLIHIDAHDDLNSPSLRATSDISSFSPAIGGVMKLDDANSIRSATVRGFVGIGGFIAPMIHAKRITEMIHVKRQESDVTSESLDVTSDEKTGFLKVGRGDWKRKGTRLWNMNLRDALANAEKYQGNILLDIDLDYFCNRFDTHGGESTSDETASAYLETTLELLLGSNLPRRALATTVAFSPGFFPAKLWPVGLRFTESLRMETLN
jgi:UPF0489 domain